MEVTWFHSDVVLPWQATHIDCYLVTVDHSCIVSTIWFTKQERKLYHPTILTFTKSVMMPIALSTSDERVLTRPHRFIFR